MLLLFHDIGMPVWGIFLFLFGLFIGPIFTVIGIYYLWKKLFETSTLILTGLVFFLFAFTYYLFFVSSFHIEFFAYLTAPFGSTAAFLVSIAGFPDSIAYVIGILINTLSIFTLVKIIEKRF